MRLHDDAFVEVVKPIPRLCPAIDNVAHAPQRHCGTIQQLARLNFRHELSVLPHCAGFESLPGRRHRDSVSLQTGTCPLTLAASLRLVQARFALQQMRRCPAQRQGLLLGGVQLVLPPKPAICRAFARLDRAIVDVAKQAALEGGPIRSWHSQLFAGTASREARRPRRLQRAFDLLRIAPEALVAVSWPLTSPWLPFPAAPAAH